MLPLDMVCGSEGAGEKEEAPEVVGCKEGVASALCPENREDTSDWEGRVEGEVDVEVDPEDHREADPTQLSLLPGVRVPVGVATEEGEAALAVGDAEGNREGVEAKLP